MTKTKLSNKGKIVIPKQVRIVHGWEPGLEFVVEDTGNGIKLKPIKPYKETTIEKLLGCVNYKGSRKSLKDMEAAIAKGARENSGSPLMPIFWFEFLQMTNRYRHAVPQKFCGAMTYSCRER